MYKVLIADDEELERKALKHILQQKMPELEVVGAARNGDEALDLARESCPDIVLLDIKMPGITGLEAAREMMRLNQETRIIITTAFDNFEFAQEALHLGAYDYLLKPVHPNHLLAVLENCIKDIEARSQIIDENTKIKEHLAEVGPYIESSFIYDLVNGSISGKEEIERRASVLGITQLPSSAMVIAFERGYKPQSHSEFQYQLIKQKVFEVAKACFKDLPSVSITPFTADKFVLLVPWNGRNRAETHYDFCQQRGEAIIQELAQFDISVSIGIGKYYQDIGKIRQSYLEALEAQRWLAFTGRSKITNGMNSQQNGSIAQFRAYQNKIDSELVDLICAGDWGRLREELDILWNNIRLSNAGEELQKAFALELLVVLYRSVIMSNKTQQISILNLSSAKKVMDSNTSGELRDCLYEAILEIIEIVQTGKEESLGSLITIVKSFIHKNFSQDITLEDAAHLVHVSPCYLSRVFSQEVGVPFKKYLITVKLDYARRLLLSTNKSINEIALESGYHDISYFCRAFKKNVGIPPYEYRIKNLT